MRFTPATGSETFGTEEGDTEATASASWAGACFCAAAPCVALGFWGEASLVAPKRPPIGQSRASQADRTIRHAPSRRHVAPVLENPPIWAILPPVTRRSRQPASMPHVANMISAARLRSAGGEPFLEFPRLPTCGPVGVADDQLAISRDRTMRLGKSSSAAVTLITESSPALAFRDLMTALPSCKPRRAVL